ncbi:MAG: ABC transporter ATP-binding protein [Ilumatobacteraceae bacterium]
MTTAATRWDVARVASLGAVTAAPLPILLFRRPEVAAGIAVEGAVVVETATLGLVAALVAVAVPWLNRRVRSGRLVVGGGLLLAAGALVMGLVDQIGPFWVGGVLLAAGGAIGIVLQRIVLTEHPVLGDRFRTMAWYWGGVALGALAPFVPLLWHPYAPSTGMRAIGVAAAIAVIFAVPLGRLTDPADVEGETTRSSDPRTPWGRRAAAASFGAGALVIGGADSALELIAVEWQRTPTETAAVLGAGPLAALVISWFGPWYHRLARLERGRRADAAGPLLLVGGALVLAGGLSITYFGMVATWLVAGGAFALAATTLDAATFESFTVAARRRVAARQAVALAVGAFVSALLLSGLVASWSPHLRLALAAMPLIVVGWRVRRGAPSARDASTASEAADATTLPRRVYDPPGDGEDASEAAVPLLSVERLDVAYHSVQVLFDVDLTVREEEVVALLGTNGAGKTTLLRAISGLEPASGGRIVYAGLDVTKTRPTWRVGMGLQQIVGGSAVAPSLTVDENLRLFGFTVDSADAESGTEEALELFPRLRERHDQLAGTLSGGEKQMLALAKALITRPRLLLVDEFSLGLAPTVVADLLPVVRTIASRGSAVLLVEQSVNIALALADRAYVMEKGEIRFEGPAAELRDQPELLQAAYLEGLAHALESQ